MELQWPLILFTTLLAWAAGVFGAQCLYALRGQGTRAQMPALITSAVLLVVGGIAVFFHLEHWERIFNGFGHITSGSLCTSASVNGSRNSTILRRLPSGSSEPSNDS